jgi:hypothetical protein
MAGARGALEPLGALRVSLQVCGGQVRPRSGRHAMAAWSVSALTATSLSTGLFGGYLVATPAVTEAAFVVMTLTWLHTILGLLDSSD